MKTTILVAALAARDGFAQTLQPIVEKLHATFTAGIKTPEVRERILKQGFDIVGSSPPEFAAYVKAEIPKWAKVVKASGAKVD